MIAEYKGVILSKNDDIANFIQTFHIINRDDFLQCLDADIPLQKLIKKHYRNQKIKILLFNLIPYATFYSIIS